MRWSRWLKKCVIAALLALVIVAFAGFYTARTAALSSLPRKSGTAPVEGLSRDVRIARDSRAIPTIAAETLDDVFRAQGYLAAQDRFFQMDLMRRNAAGRLAELVGGAIIQRDREMRVLRLQAAADRAVEALPPEHRRWLDSYAQGVNAGLTELEARPPEYFALWSQPEPWRARDTILVLFTMYEQLELDWRSERMVGVMRDTLPPEFAEFLTPETTRWDTLVGPPDRAPVRAIPGPDVIDLRGTKPAAVGSLSPLTDLALADLESDRAARGSNGWAVAGSRTTHGGAILANDMHLGYSAPGIWYRAAFEWGGVGAAKRTAVGVTLPGAPGLIAGSTDDLAWGFTNVTGDFSDLVRVEVDPADPSRYRTPEGWEPFTEAVEEIGVRGQPAERLTIRGTRWGPVVDKDHKGRPLVLKWIALEPGGADVRLFDLLNARTLEEGVEIARSWRGPPQNVMLAARDGRIAWTISGMLPNRRGFDGTAPASWAEGGVGWFGTLDESQRPAVINPESGVIVTANQRTAPIDIARRIGHQWSMPQRAARITELLNTPEKLDESAMLRVQLDDRVELLDFYRDQFLAASTTADPSPLVQAARPYVVAWDGHARADHRGTRLIAGFRTILHTELGVALTAPCAAAEKEFRYSWLLQEESLRQLLEQRPLHLTPPGHESWEAFVRASLLKAMDAMSKTPPGVGLEATWGRFNAMQARHPVSAAVPQLSKWLDLPATEQSGHLFAVRVASRGFGASERLAVSPGQWSSAILHMPGGQSGHPLSEHYTDQHADWAEGRATALMPGETVRTITLTAPK